MILTVIAYWVLGILTGALGLLRFIEYMRYGPRRYTR